MAIPMNKPSVLSVIKVYGAWAALVVVALALVVFLFNIRTFSPPIGQEYVLIKHPWFFGQGGLVKDPLQPGRYWGFKSTEPIAVNVQPQKFDVEMKDTMTSDGVPITFHAIMNIQITDSVKLIGKFGPNWYSNSLEQQFSQMVRQAVRKRGMNETAISTTAIEQIDEEIRFNLVKYIEAKELPLSLNSMTVGKANPPDAVKNQRIATATQEQRIQTEQKTKLAEDQRKSAEESRAAADNAYRENMHLSPEQFVQLETIKMQKEVCGGEAKSTCTFIQNGVPSVYNLNK